MNEDFNDVRRSIEEGLELIKKENLSLYNHLKDSIRIDEKMVLFVTNLKNKHSGIYRDGGPYVINYQGLMS